MIPSIRRELVLVSLSSYESASVLSSVVDDESVEELGTERMWGVSMVAYRFGDLEGVFRFSGESRVGSGSVPYWSGGIGGPKLFFGCFVGLTQGVVIVVCVSISMSGVDGVWCVAVL